MNFSNSKQESTTVLKFLSIGIVFFLLSLQTTGQIDFTVSKTADPTSISSPTTIDYEIIIVNTGTDSIRNVTVDDSLVDDVVTLISGDTDGDNALDTNETWVYTASYNATQADIDAGTDLINTATVNVAGTAPKDALATTEIIVEPSLDITKTASPTSISGPSTIDYTITIENTGNVSLTGVSVTDEIAGNASLQSGDTNNNNAIDLEETWVYTASYNATQTDIDAGNPIVNTAGVTTDRITDEQTASATTTITQEPSLNITKTASPTSISTPGTIDYTINIDNTGNLSLTGVNVTDAFAEGADYTSGDTNNNGVLETDETWIYTASYEATQADIDADNPIVNTAGVTTDRITDEQTATATTTITQEPSLSITKTASPTSISTPGTIDYTINIDNTGNLSLTGVNVTDAFAGGANYTSGDTNTNGALDTDETWVYTASYEATQADIDAGDDLVNTAAVTTNQTTQQTADATTTISQDASLNIAKTASSTSISVPTTIDYTITIENTGNVRLSGVSVTDAFTGSVSYDSGDSNSNGELDIDETWVYTASYEATQTNIDAGNDLVNTAAVTTNQTTQQTADATTTISQNPSISVSKTSASEGYSLLGDQLNYTISVENTGNVTLANIQVIDSKTNLNETISSLAVGATETFNQSYSVIQSDINNGSVENTASASFSFNGSDFEESATWIIDAFGPPVATNDNSLGNQPGNNASVDILDNDELKDGSQASVANSTFYIADPSSGDPILSNILNVAGEGEWILSPSTGLLTFDPEAGFTTDPTPIDYILIEDATGSSDGATVTVEYIETEPSAADDNNTGNQPGGNAEIDILSNDALSDGTQATTDKINVELLDPDTGEPAVGGNTLSIAGEGTWDYNSGTGILTFDPQVGFTTDPSGISYRLTENITGLSDDATVTVDYTGSNPVAVNDASSGNRPGDNASVNILANDELSDGSPATTGNTSVELLDPESGNPASNPNGLTIPGEGSWSYSPALGVAVFDPEIGFTTDPSPVSYLLTEVLTGLSNDATISMEYNEVPPIAADDEVSGIQPGQNATVNILSNDALSDGSSVDNGNIIVELIDPSTGQASTTAGQVIVSGEGEWSLESTGDLTFDPLAGFTVSPTPLIYVLTEELTGLSDNASVTFEYEGSISRVNDDRLSDLEPGNLASINILLNDSLSDGTPATLLNSEIALIDPTTGNPSVLPHSLSVEGEGDWLFNPTNGFVSFIPVQGFTTSPTQLDYQLTEQLSGVTARATVVFTYASLNPVANNDAAEGNESGDPVIVDILANDAVSDGSQATTENTSVGLIDPETGNTSAVPHTVIIADQGEYNYNPANGLLTFSPEEGFDGTPLPIDYLLTEELTGLSDEATVNIGTVVFNRPPVAEDDNVFATDCDPILIDVLQNDSDPDNDDLEAPVVISGVDVGTLRLNGNNVFEYTPEKGFNGQVTFTYEICDQRRSSARSCDQATVTITINTDLDCDQVADIDDLDDDNDGIPDVEEGNGAVNSDNDEFTDDHDIDSDNDGIPDNIEWQTEADYISLSGADVNENGWDDAYDSATNGSYVLPLDTDSDNLPDYIDPDSDDDNIPDLIEGNDADYNNVADVIPTGVDFDSDGLDDVFDTVGGWNPIDNPAGSNVALQNYDGDSLPDWRDLDDDNDGIPTTGIDDKISVLQCELLVPEIFSPNGDGIQDYFRIVCIENYPNASIKIYNRWSNLVYEKENYGNTDIWGITDAWWNGHSYTFGKLGTEKLPPGTYFYVLELNDGTKPVNGFVYLNR